MKLAKRTTARLGWSMRIHVRGVCVPCWGQRCGRVWAWDDGSDEVFVLFWAARLDGGLRKGAGRQQAGAKGEDRRRD